MNYEKLLKYFVFILLHTLKSKKIRVKLNFQVQHNSSKNPKNNLPKNIISSISTNEVSFNNSDSRYG